MPRRILSTAALAAFLASGHPIIPTTERRDEQRAQASGRTLRMDAQVIDLDGRLLAVDVQRRDTDVLDVAVQLEGPLIPVHLWTGAKNAWGSTITTARPQADLPGFLRAEVALIPGSDRLWIGIARDGLRPAVGALRLDTQA